MENLGLNFRESGAVVMARGKGNGRVAGAMRVASSKTSSQLWRIGGRGDSCLGTVRDSACGELLNCLRRPENASNFRFQFRSYYSISRIRESYTSAARPGTAPYIADNSYPSILIPGGACAPSEIKWPLYSAASRNSVTVVY
ncbi:hypothetical protein PUN28_013276 [Cardiocondyla obscurior]|uniref:Uncharacterized protein n=1 Tax=Cardiocondyla obscurior TaxID=286306 RepID=A0AAW2FBP1_9HYME